MRDKVKDDAAFPQYVRAVGMEIPGHYNSAVCPSRSEGADPWRGCLGCLIERAADEIERLRIIEARAKDTLVRKPGPSITCKEVIRMILGD